MFLNCIAVGIGGFIGSIARYLFGIIPIKENTAFPINTLLINVIGAFAISFIVGVFAKNSSLDPRLLLLLKAGFCGGFTTFSTFALDCTNLMKNGSAGLAFLYIVLSVVLCIAACFAGNLISAG